MLIGELSSQKRPNRGQKHHSRLPGARPGRPKDDLGRHSRLETEGSRSTFFIIRVSFAVVAYAGGGILLLGSKATLGTCKKTIPRDRLAVSENRRKRARRVQKVCQKRTPRERHAPGGREPKNRPKCCLKRAQIAKNVTSPHARDG